MALQLFFHSLDILIIVAAAVGLGAWVTRRFGLGWRLYWIGASAFVLSQVGHIPFNYGLSQLFARQVLSLPPGVEGVLLNAALVGLSAGVWEELTRAAIYRWWARDARSWGRGLLLGAGHGGIEALIVAGLAFWALFQAFALLDVELSRVVAPERLPAVQQFMTVYWSSPWYDSLLPAVERLFTLAVHLSCSVLVLQVFVRRGGAAWLAAAIGWHALVDASVVAVIGLTKNPYLAEGVLSLFALASLGILLALRQPEPAPQVSDPLPLPGSAAPLISVQDLPAVEENLETLDKTRYQ